MNFAAAAAAAAGGATTVDEALTAIAPSGRYYNPVVMSFIRDDWIQQQLHLRQAAYTAFQRTRVVAGTWNVNAKKPLADDAAKLLQWLLPPSGGAGLLPDVVALGLQEIVDLNAVNVVVNSTLSSQRSAAWEEAVLAALNSVSPAQQYKVVMEKHLVGILLLVFVKVEHAAFIRDVRGATAGVGIMGVMGNKGGVAVRLNLYDSTLCFVCAHLAAHRENVAGRNADYLSILSKIEFRDSDSDSWGADTRQLSGEPAILNHDFVFWLGDLNYRIADDVPVDVVFQHAESGGFKELLQRDQLTLERKRGRAFRGFKEGAITFPPTYKYQAGTAQYEKRPEKKLRAPAWCDRVLWRAKHAEHVALLCYAAVHALDLSDHKPVHAAFEVQVRHQVEAKKAQVVREIMLQLDKWENENMPRVRLTQSDGAPLSSGLLGFARLKFGVDQTRTLCVENTGVVVAHFRFIPKLDDAELCKPWLAVAPAFGMIPPKERVAIRVTAHVDEATAHALAGGDESLDDTMILRVENGRDYFLVVSGQYDNSCFGNSLEQLVRSAQPARQTRPPAPPAAGVFRVADDAAPASSPHQIPKELWRMANDLFQHFLDERNLFVEAGDKREVLLLREALDTGSPFPRHSAHSAAELLLAWLQSLRQSVVPDAVLAAALEAGGGHLAHASRALLDALPPVRFNVLVYLVSFLKEVLKHQSANKLTPEKLAFVFARGLVSPYRAPRALLHPAATGAATAVAASNQSSVLPEEKLRRSARELEAAQSSAAQRAEAMEKLLLHLITTNAQ
ncbi:hypothetical protein PybrP1_008848 [[Pythium] brassicae (nom. inval.)]|nr:hypothetical protein PybrP1_008848 [[Pythium] brassicae (nom. inval.)]